MTKTLMITFLILTAGTAGAQPTPDFAAIASQLPKLEITEGRVTLPLRTEGTSHAWRGIDPSIHVGETDGALNVRYTVTANRPAGVAIVLPSGTFGNLATLRLQARSERTATIIPTLRNADGVVFAFPSVTLPAKRDVEVALSVDELRYFAPQSSGPEPEGFDPADAVLLTLVDIAGFMGGADGRETIWTITAIEGEIR